MFELILIILLLHLCIFLSSEHNNILMKGVSQRLTNNYYGTSVKCGNMTKKLVDIEPENRDLIL